MVANTHHSSFSAPKDNEECDSDNIKECNYFVLSITKIRLIICRILHREKPLLSLVIKIISNNHDYNYI